MLTTFLHYLVARPCIYNIIQKAFFLRQFDRRLSPHLASAGHKTVLDVGAGTGLVTRILPNTAHYIWYDSDSQKYKGFKRTKLAHSAILGDGTRISLKNKSVDWALCMALSHHLTDEQLPLLVSELARVVRQRLIFFDSLASTASIVSRVLQRYDRGLYRRSEDVLCPALERWFEIEHRERFVVHGLPLILCVCRPRG